MNIWFTADLHLGHKNIIKYCNRPFKDVEEMDRVLIKNWNDLVKPKDQIYVVGDFTLGNRRAAVDYLHELNGEIFVLPGSHDRWIDDKSVPYLVMLSRSNNYIRFLSSVYTFEPNGITSVTLYHHPMRSWPLSHYGSWHLFGHHHGKLEPYGLSFDIGVDTHDFSPWHIDEVAEKMKTLKPIVDYSKG